MINVPLTALAAAVAMVLYASPTKTKKLAKESAGSCQSRYCRPVNMFVDKPLNTLLKDQSLGCGLQRPPTLPGSWAIYHKIKTDLQREQLLSPGVNRVAHAVA